jgi:uncharacterized membrane protein
MKWLHAAAAASSQSLNAVMSSSLNSNRISCRINVITQNLIVECSFFPVTTTTTMAKTRNDKRIEKRKNLLSNSNIKKSILVVIVVVVEE